MMTPTSSRAMAASPWYHACSSRRKRSSAATTPSEPKTIPGSCVDDAGGSEATSVSTPKARNGCGSSLCSSRAIDDFPELDAPLRTITALRTPTTVAQVGPRPMANCFPAGPTMTGRIEDQASLSVGRSTYATHLRFEKAFSIRLGRVSGLLLRIVERVSSDVDLVVSDPLAMGACSHLSWTALVRRSVGSAGVRLRPARPHQPRPIPRAGGVELRT